MCVWGGGGPAPHGIHVTRHPWEGVGPLLYMNESALFVGLQKGTSPEDLSSDACPLRLVSRVRTNSLRRGSHPALSLQ